MIGGFGGNWAAPGTLGVTIGGGGVGNYSGNAFSNSASANFSTIGGGWQHQIQGNATASTIGGGQLNLIQAFEGTISGGYGNNIAVDAHDAVIGGGDDNTNASANASIGGGQDNSIQPSSDKSTIAGGANNSIQQGTSSAIGGGQNNSIQTTTAVVAGGQGNSIQASTAGSAIGGGGANSITFGTYSVIPGGYNNTVGASYSFAAGKYANAANIGSFVWSDASQGSTTTTANNQFMVRCSGGAIFYTAPFPNTSTGVQLASGGGSWSSLSDLASKENVAPVDAKAILEKVAQIPVSTWNYKAQDTSIRHVGPMAQDFYAAFNVGEDNRHITTVDEGGVALAAIQGLNQKLEQQSKDKDAEIQDLKQSLSELKKLVQSLVEKK
jgi:hypothetical protein